MAQKKPTYEAPAPAEDKKKALETALHNIEKNFGKEEAKIIKEEQRWHSEAKLNDSYELEIKGENII